MILATLAINPLPRARHVPAQPRPAPASGRRKPAAAGRNRAYGQTHWQNPPSRRASASKPAVFPSGYSHFRPCSSAKRSRPPPGNNTSAPFPRSGPACGRPAIASPAATARTAAAAASIAAHWGQAEPSGAPRRPIRRGSAAGAALSAATAGAAAKDAPSRTRPTAAADSSSRWQVFSHRSGTGMVRSSSSPRTLTHRRAV